METITYDDYVRHYYDELDARPGLRLGQTAFNVLVSDNPKLAERVRSTALDPFYADFRLPDFFNFVSKHWEGCCVEAP